MPNNVPLEYCISGNYNTIIVSSILKIIKKPCCSPLSSLAFGIITRFEI